jgi:hypothetical protein
MNSVPTFKSSQTFIHWIKNAIYIEQTTTFHACSVSKLMLILIDINKRKGCSSETSMKKKKN